MEGLIVKSKAIFKEKIPDLTMVFDPAHIEKGVFGIFLFISLLWCWYYPFLPLQDLPAHLAHSYILAHYQDYPAFNENFWIRISLYPYLVQDLILVILYSLHIPAAGKILVSLILVAIPFSSYFLIKSINPNRGYLAFWCFPFLLNKLLMKGNLNYLLGLAFGLFFLGLLLRFIKEEKPTTKKTLILALAGALLLLNHLVAFALIWLLAVIILIFHAYTNQWNWNKPALWALASCLLFAVAVLVLNPVYESQKISLLALIFKTSSISGKFAEIKSLLLCFSHHEWKALAPVLIAGGLLFVLGLVEIKKQPLPFLLCGILFFGYLVSPRELGALVRPHERILFLLIFLLPICFCFSHYVKLQKLLLVIICFYGFVRISQHMFHVSDKIVPMVKEAREVINTLPDGERLLPIWGKLPYTGQIGIGGHIEAYYIIDKKGYVPSIFTGPYFLLRHKNPKDKLYDSRKFSPSHFPQYDALFVWGDGREMEAKLKKENFKNTARKNIFGVYRKDPAGKQ